MVEITLPCCDTIAMLDSGADELRCEGCGLTHELAPDARETVTGELLPIAA